MKGEFVVLWTKRRSWCLDAIRAGPTSFSNPVPYTHQLFSSSLDTQQAQTPMQPMEHTEIADTAFSSTTHTRNNPILTCLGSKIGGGGSVELV